jgi:ABC-type amino acid transport substrate-binding protein
VDVWKQTAQKHNLEYEFICIPRVYDDAVKKLSDDVYDVVLAEISVINRRFDWALYSRPYFVSELYLYRKSNNSFLKFFEDVQLKYILGIVCFIVFMYTLILMKLYNIIFIDAFYKSMVSFLSIGGEIITPNRRLHSLQVKGLNTFWSFFIFFFRAFIISRIIASVVSAKDVIDDEELSQINNVYVMSNSANSDIVKMFGKTPVGLDTPIEIAVKIYESESNEYWFEDSNTINSTMKEANRVTKLTKTERPMVMDEFTIAVNKKFPEVVNMINSTLVEMQDNGTMLRICKGYIDNYDRCLL